MVLSAILELAEELQQGTIERVLAKSDLELVLLCQIYLIDFY